MSTWRPMRQMPFNKIKFFIEDFTKFFNNDFKTTFTPHFCEYARERVKGGSVASSKILSWHEKNFHSIFIR